MGRKVKNDWTDELRASVQGTAVEPSDAAWERLAAAMPARRTSWVPYALAAACCCIAVCGVFIFRNPAPEVVETPMAQVNIVADQEDTAVSQEAESLPVRLAQAVPAKGKPAAENAAPAADDSVAEDVDERENEPAENDTAAAEIQSAAEEPVAAGIYPEEPVAAEEEPVAAAEEIAAADLGQESAAIAPQADIDPFAFEDDEPDRPRVGRIAISVSVGGSPVAGSGSTVTRQAVQSGILAVKGDDMEMQYSDVVDITDIVDHEMPKMFDVDVLVPVSPRIGIKTGVEYSDLRSRVGNGAQYMQWLGVPLGLDCAVADWGFSRLGAGAAVKAEKCLSASLMGIDCYEKPQLSLGLDATWNVKISGPLYFRLSPQLSWYFTDTELPTYHSSHPVSFTMHAGFTFRL